MNSLASILLSNLLVACIIAMIATLVGWSGRRAAIAHLLWVAVFVKLVTPPIVPAPVSLPSAWFGQIQAAQQFINADFRLDARRQTVAGSENGASATSGVQTRTGSGEVTPASSADATARWPTLSVGSCLIAIWLAGAIALIMRGVLRFMRFSLLLRRESVFDDDASAFVRQLLRRDEKGFAPPVCRISARISPMLFGMGRATWIICPNSLWTSLSESQRHSFLAHEVAHYQRRDHWVRWLEWLVTAIYWWMPLIYLARLQLERHEEAACDAWALGQLETSPRSYAETLLSVVDFLSESRTGAPRLASRMQPTAALEERLRLIMQWHQPTGCAGKRHVALAACCAALLIVHPTPLLSHMGVPARVAAPAELVATGGEPDRSPIVDSDGDSDRRSPLIDLPSVPVGWWNSTPSRTWADKVLGENELRLLARVGIGIGVSQPGGPIFTFDAQKVRALAYVVPSGRLVVGTSSGELHLWDAEAHQSVSLVGKHNASIESIAFHPSGGLISGDQAGTVISWDIRSGQMLATRSFNGPIGSVRWSSDGNELAVLVGDWTSDQPAHRLHLLDAEQLETRQSVELPSTIAVVPHDAQLQWLAVDWSGVIWSLTDARVAGILEKQLVSGAVMCQDLFSISSAGQSNNGMASELRQQ